MTARFFMALFIILLMPPFYDLFEARPTFWVRRGELHSLGR